MCGIFGVIQAEGTVSTERIFDGFVRSLFLLSESRGKEASGLVGVSRDSLIVYKEPSAASELVRTSTYASIRKKYGHATSLGVHALIGHARLVTNGSLFHESNNQPVIKDNIVGVHNGIIVNDAELWRKFPILTRTSEVDTEVLLALMRYFVNMGHSETRAFIETMKYIEGSVAASLLCAESDSVILGTNNGSLYRMYNTTGSWHFFASEEYILKQLQKKYYSILGTQYVIEKVRARTGYVLSLRTLGFEDFSFQTESGHTVPMLTTSTMPDNEDVRRDIVCLKSENAPSHDISRPTNPKMYDEYLNHYQKKRDIIETLQRCRTCILPSSMPFIEFDSAGVCNYCRNYKRQTVRGEDEFKSVIQKYRSGDGSVDCVMGLSGGRDSSYGLHYIVKEANMNPVSFSYDWGMITDEGRRNQARMSGALGVEHILISADIQRKRKYIRKNVLAWLQRPDLGMIPLFMAGDKQYFYHAHQLKKHLGAKTIILCASPYEKTDFKTGFCGIKPVFNFKKAHYELTNWGKVRLAFYYLRQFIRNPRYVNVSLIDTIGAYLSYYFLPHDYVLLFDYIPWNENILDSTLLEQYKWQSATDTAHTWRIVDGTAAFYNYIYYIVAGFTENDTFRSNQIREGVITREEGLRLAIRDNAPRFQSIQWYCDVIDIDFNTTLQTIHSIKTRYEN